MTDGSPHDFTGNHREPPGTNVLQGHGTIKVHCELGQTTQQWAQEPHCRGKNAGTLTNSLLIVLVLNLGNGWEYDGNGWVAGGMG